MRAMRFVLLVCVLAIAVGAAKAQFVQPTADELAMKEVPGFPGAPAVVLYREEITRDELGDELHYERIKVLTEAGKKYADVAFNFVEGYDQKQIVELTGRTIHADGSIVPFTGKPYMRELEKGKGYKVRQMAFTLPVPEVGSILEYRYKVSYEQYAEPPEWDIQNELPQKKVLLIWEPSYNVQDPMHRKLLSIAWSQILPADVKVERSPKDVASVLVKPNDLHNEMYVVRMSNISPEPSEELMPPLSSVKYSVRFSYTHEAGTAKFWTANGAEWSKNVDKFSAPNEEIKKTAAEIVAETTSDDEKLKKIYAAMMTLENTDFTRNREQKELKAEGLGKVKTASDVWTLKRGSSVEIAGLFLALVRAEGMQAFAMRVPNRSEEIFDPQWLDAKQLSDEIVLVTVNGKEKAFDPGSWYGEFGRLVWTHTDVQGVRQTEHGAVMAVIPADSPRANVSNRVAKLTMDETGKVSGRVELTFTGSLALPWRRALITGDAIALEDKLRRELASQFGKTTEISDVKNENAKDFTRPLEISFSVRGTIGQVAGQRVLAPVDVFAPAMNAGLTAATRITPISFECAQLVQDTLQLKLPKGMKMEAIPVPQKFSAGKYADYDAGVSEANGTISAWKRVVVQMPTVPANDYAVMREFAGRVRAEDAVVAAMTR